LLRHLTAPPFFLTLDQRVFVVHESLRFTVCRIKSK
jgi:hypothetical protein